MKITDVQAIILRQPEMDVSKSDGSQDALVLRIETDEDITGLTCCTGMRCRVLRRQVGKSASRES